MLKSKITKYLSLPPSVYGTITFNVSLDNIKSRNEESALLKAEERINSYNIAMDKLSISNENGEILGTLTVHNVEVDWKTFFAEEES